MSKTEIFEKIKAERQRQVDKWGEQHHLDHAWQSILAEEIGEVANELNEWYNKKQDRGTTVANMKNELIQCAAVIVAWLEDTP